MQRSYSLRIRKEYRMATKHTRRSFSKRSLVHPQLGSSLPPSMPLVIPNDLQYDFSSNALRPIAGERRSSLKIVPETLQLLEGVSGPVGMLAIGGPCRTGKSYVLSRMLGSGDAFALGHTMDPKTFGIWIGTTVLECDEFTLFLMDTEGIDAAHARTRDDASVLVMTVLLSSYFIYNSMGVPRRNDLEKMSYFSKLATSITVSQRKTVSDDSEDDSFKLKNHFPDFLWLLRDVILIPTGDDGKEISPTDYLLKRVLKKRRAFNENEGDRVSCAILSFFPCIQCKTIIPPSSDPAVMRNIAARQSSLDPLFNKQVDELVQYLFQHVTGKKGFHGKLADGPILAAMATQYLKAINSPDAIPCITDTWQAAIEIRCRKVLKDLLSEYQSEMERKVAEVGLPMEEDLPSDTDPAKPFTLYGIHRSILLRKTKSLTKQIGHFLSSYFGSQDGESPSVFTIEGLQAELERGTAVFKEEVTAQKVPGGEARKKVVTGGILLQYAQQNHSCSRLSCAQLFEHLYKAIDECVKAADHSYSFKQLLEDLKQLQWNYFGKAIGPAKWEVYDEKQAFVKSQQEGYKVLHGYKKKAFEEAQKVTEARAEAAKAGESLCILKTQMKNNAKLNQQRIQDLEQQNKEDMHKFQSDQLEKMEMERERVENFMKAQMTQMAELAKESREQMSKQYDMVVKIMDTMSKQNQKNMAVLVQTVDNCSEALAKISSEGNQGRGGLFSMLGKFVDDLFTSSAPQALLSIGKYFL